MLCHTGYIPEPSKPMRADKRDNPPIILENHEAGKDNNCLTLVERDPPKDRRGDAEILEVFIINIRIELFSAHRSLESHFTLDSRIQSRKQSQISFNNFSLTTVKTERQLVS